MGSLITIKRLAADILNVGRNRVRIKINLGESEQKQLDEAITRVNVKDLIKDKIIYAKGKQGRKKVKKRKKKGIGKRRGKEFAKKGSKKEWMELVRAQRKYLNKLLDNGNIEKEKKRALYLRIKGGIFRSKSAFLAYLKDNGLYTEKKVVEKKVK